MKQSVNAGGQGIVDFYKKNASMMTEDDQILLFTEHNLDTKEDEKTEKAPIKSAESSKMNQLFDKKQDNFKKFDGFAGK